MKKIGKVRFDGFHQMCITMKLTTLLLTVVLMEAHAGGIAQNVSLNGQNLSLKKVFAEIKHQTGYAFFYNYALLKEAHTVSLNVKGAPLTQVLDLCFSGQPLDYSIENKTVVITRRAVAEDASPVVTDVQPTAADNVVVKGKVTDEKGEPLAGVTVHLKDTKKGTTTDENGVFSISVPVHSVLVISSVGYQSKEINASKDETINIQLVLGNKSVDEVVVTGFGETRSKQTLGYSVTQISGDDIRATAQLNPINALQGMVTGLQVQPGVAGAASTPKVLIRGSSSLNPYENMPLVVVDGVILDDQSVTPNRGSADFGNILKDLNPDDIESESILKGGAVTALYGSRAANGVLLIKTKKGFAMKGLGVSFSQSVVWDKAYKTTDFQNVYGEGLYIDDWGPTVNGLPTIDANNYGASFGPKMTGQLFQDMYGGVRKNNPMPNSLLDIFQTGLTSNTNVSIVGGNENSTIRMSYSRLGSNTVLPNNKFDRNSFTVRATHKIGSWFLLDGNATYVHSYNKNPPQQGGSSPLYALAYDGARNYDMGYYSKHYFDSANGGINRTDFTGLVGAAFWPIYANNDFQTEDNLRAGIDLTATLLPWLVFNGNASMNLYNKNYQADSRGQNVGYGDPGYNGSVTDLLQARYRGDFLFTKKFTDFTTALHVGGEVFTSGQTGNSYSMNTGVLPDIYRLSNSANPPTITENKPNNSQLTSLYFQGTIDYHNFLALNIYGRNDWNSSLVYNDQHGKYSYFYGGADMAFVFTDLLKNKTPWLNFGKLRLSYAQGGNGTDSYVTSTGSYTSQGTYTGGPTTVSQYSFSSNALGNQALVPEKSDKIETGLELQFLHHRLGLDFTAYTQDTKGQIINFNVPAASGVTSALLNGGTVRNRGIEFAITAVPIQTRAFSWTSRFLYTLNRNTVISLPFGTTYLGLEGEDGIQDVAVKGGDYGTMVASYGYAHYTGSGSHDPLAGQRVLGVVGNGTQSYYVRATNYGTTPTTQQPVIGSIQPKFLGSWTNTFTYKGFSLGVMLDARIGGIEYSTSYFYGSQAGSIKSTLAGRDAEHGGIAFTPTNSTSQYTGIPLGTTTRNDGIALKGVYQAGSTSLGSDGATHDVSGMTYDQAYKLGYVTPVNAMDYYIKTYSWSAGIREAGVFTNSWVSLRQVSIGYDVPNSIARKIKLNNLRVSLIGRNLIYLYNSAPDHINPENLNDSGSGSAFEEGGVPYVRSYGFMFNTSF